METNQIKKTLYDIIAFLAFVPFCILTFMVALIAKSKCPEHSKEARIVWGPSPIINNKYWSQAMKNAGYSSQTYMMGFSQAINKKADYDEYYYDRLPGVPAFIRRPVLFWESLLRFDVFVISFEGWLLRNSIFQRLEPLFFKLANKRVVVIPYGSDGYVYRNIRSPSLAHGLMMSYPELAKKQDYLEDRIKLWTKHADFVFSVIMGIDGMGRWDIPCLSPLCIDTEQWAASTKVGTNASDGTKTPVTVVHTPNHTGFKGSEFIEDAVKRLQAEGLNIELKLIQNTPNDQIREILHSEADILVEQLIVTGHGMSAVEGMASGLPVISNLEDENYTTIFRRYSYLNECPILSATPETIYQQLKLLVKHPDLRAELGALGRQYVEKYHSYEAATYLFSSILKFVYGEVASVMNLFHPLLKERQADAIITPLVKNHFPEHDIKEPS